MKKLSALVLALVGFVALQASAQTVLYTEDFEGGAVPAGWRTGKGPNSVGWQYGDSATYSSQYFVLRNSTKFMVTNDDKYDNSSATRNQATNDSLITAPFDFTGVTRDVYLVMNTRYTWTTSTQGYSWAIVLASADNGATWTAVDTLRSSYFWNEYRFRVNDYAGFQSNDSIRFCFKYDDRGKWGYGWAIDNLQFIELPQGNAALEVRSYSKYHTGGLQNISIPVYLTSFSSGTLNTLVVKYQLPDGTIQSRNLSNLGIAAFESKYNTPQGFQLNITANELHYIKIWIESPNGFVDSDPSDDTTTIFLSGVSSIADRKIFVEEYTGAWCQYCPDGQVRLNQLVAGNRNVIPAAAHFGFGDPTADQMETDETYEVNIYFSEGHPSASFDRYRRPAEDPVGYSRNTWTTAASQRLNNYKVPVNVSMTHTYNEATRDLSVTVTGKWIGADSGDFRFNVVIVEDSLVGVGDGWDQANYYNTSVSHPYYQAGDPIVGFVHRHVVRDYLGGAWGDETSGIPTRVSSGDEYSKTFTFNIPAGWREDQITLVGMVQEYTADPYNRQVFNSVDTVLLAKTPSSVNNGVTAPQAQSVLGPNPVRDNNATLTLVLPAAQAVSFSLQTTNGQVINSGQLGTLGAGTHSFAFGTFSPKALSAGVYLLRIGAGDTALTHKVIVVE